MEPRTDTELSKVDLERILNLSEFEAPAIQSAIEIQAADLGFAVEQRTVEVRGVCRGCRPAESIGSS